MAATPDDLLSAIKALTTAVEKANRAQDENARAKRKRGSGGGKGKGKGKGGKGGDDTAGDLVGNYQQVYGSAKGVVGNLAHGNISGAVMAGRGVVTGARALMGAGGSAGGGAAAGAGAMGAATAATGGVLLAVATFAALAYAGHQFVEAMDEATRKTIEHYKTLGNLSAGMASVMAQRDIREMMRDREKGDRLAGVAAALTNAEQNRADAGKELDIAWEEFKGGFLTGFQNQMAEILRILTDFATRNGLIAPKTTTGDTLGSMMDKVAKDADKKFDQHKRNVR